MCVSIAGEEIGSQIRLSRSQQKTCGGKNVGRPFFVPQSDILSYAIEVERVLSRYQNTFKNDKARLSFSFQYSLIKVRIET